MQGTAGVGGTAECQRGLHRARYMRPQPPTPTANPHFSSDLHGILGIWSWDGLERRYAPPFSLPWRRAVYHTTAEPIVYDAHAAAEVRRTLA